MGCGRTAGAAMLAAGLFGTAVGQVPTIRCRHAGTALSVDGVLDEAAWLEADSLVLVDVVSGAAPQWSTRVKTLWDSTGLYVGFVARDSRVHNTMSGHDEPLYQQDVVEVFVDPDGDGVYYYELEWNCLNAVFDLLMASAPSEPLPPGETVRNQLDWTASGMRSAVSVQGTPNADGDMDTGMTVEVALAWSDFGRSTQHMPPLPGDTLRAGFFRIEYAQSGTEYTAWSPTGEVQFHRPGLFGNLVFAGSEVGVEGVKKLEGEAQRADGGGRRAGTLRFVTDLRGRAVGRCEAAQRTSAGAGQPNTRVPRD